MIFNEQNNHGRRCESQPRHDRSLFRVAAAPDGSGERAALARFVRGLKRSFSTAAQARRDQ
jgi:hypothetical protein